MLSQLFSLLSPKKSGQQSAQNTSSSSPSSVSSQAPSLGSSSSQSWIATARDQLRRHESEVLHAYQDHLGFWTIGVGRLIDKRKGGGISKDESDYLLTNDINSRLADLNAKLPWFNTLNDPRKAVLLNMSFQLGMAGLLNFRNTLNKIQDGDFGGAADNMLKSKWAEQTPKRAQEMAEQMRKGKWQSG